MKTKLLSVALLATSLASFAQVGIGTKTPDSSAALEVASTTKGFLPPRITKTQMEAIASPAEGLMVYCTDCDPKGLYVNNGGTGNGGSESPKFRRITNTDDSAPIKLTVDCDQVALNYVEDKPFMGNVIDRSLNFQLYINNTSFANSSMTPILQDLTLSGVPGLKVNKVDPSYLSKLYSKDSLRVIYTITGTPEFAGTVTATWQKSELLKCTKTFEVLPGDAKFNTVSEKFITSLKAGALDPAVINNTTPLVVEVPFIDGIGSYNAYTSEPVTVTSEGGNSYQLTYSYPAGNFGGETSIPNQRGDIPVTIHVGGDGSFNVPQQVSGVIDTIASFDFKVNGEHKGQINLNAIGAIEIVPDLYVMPHNLGADYSLDPNVPAKGLLGDYYQYGRKDAVGDVDGIFGDWSIDSTNKSWDTTDPCPEGFKVMDNIINPNLKNEFIGSFSVKEGTYDSGVRITNINKPTNTLFLPAAGARSDGDGELNALNSKFYYWSDRTETYKGTLFGLSISNHENDYEMQYLRFYRANAMSVRCVKE